MPAALISKAEVIDKLTEVFRQWGYDGATLAKLSEATGLMKASLYHYFPAGKKDMAEAVLNNLSAQFKEIVLHPLTRAGDPKQKLEDMVENLQTFYFQGHASCVINVFSLGTAKELFGEAISQSIVHLRDHIAAVLEKAGLDKTETQKRAMNAIVTVQGALIVARALNDHTQFKTALDHLPFSLIEPD